MERGAVAGLRSGGRAGAPAHPPCHGNSSGCVRAFPARGPAEHHNQPRQEATTSFQLYISKKSRNYKKYISFRLSDWTGIVQNDLIRGCFVAADTHTRCVDSVGVSRCGHAGTRHVSVKLRFPGRAGAPPRHPYGFFQLPHHRVRGQAPPPEPPCRPRPRRGGARGARR